MHLSIALLANLRLFLRLHYYNAAIKIFEPTALSTFARVYAR